MNLLDNAAKYASAAPHIRVSVNTRHSRAEIRVEDHGAGIGFALVKEVMTGHCGQVTLDSDPGQGYCFDAAP